MRICALQLVAASVFFSHALAACSGLNAKDTGACPSAQCKSGSYTFGHLKSLVAAGRYDGNPAHASFVSELTPDRASADSARLALSLQKSKPSDTVFDGTTVYSTSWIQYGSITATIQSGSTAPGVVTSMQLQDDSGGSISLDFVGSTTNRVQANYYVDGQVDLGNPVSSVVSSDPVSNYNEYRILWQPDSISWYVNGAVIRTVHRADTWAEGLRKFTFPQKAARLSFSIWDASGSTNPYLTTAWAGSIPSSKTGAQFTAYIKSVSIKCYSNSTSTSTSSSPLGNTAHQNSNHKQSSANASSVVPASASDSDDDDLSDFGRGDSNSSLENQSSSGSSRKDGIDQISAYLERNVNSSAAASHLQGFSVISAAAAVILATAIASI